MIICPKCREPMMYWEGYEDMAFCTHCTTKNPYYTGEKPMADENDLVGDPIPMDERWEFDRPDGEDYWNIAYNIEGKDNGEGNEYAYVLAAAAPRMRAALTASLKELKTYRDDIVESGQENVEPLDSIIKEAEEALDEANGVNRNKSKGTLVLVKYHHSLMDPNQFNEEWITLEDFDYAAQMPHEIREKCTEIENSIKLLQSDAKITEIEITFFVDGVLKRWHILHNVWAPRPNITPTTIKPKKKKRK